MANKENVTLANKDPPFAKPLHVKYKLEMANRKPMEENKPEGSCFLFITGNKKLKQVQVTCQQLQTQGFHMNTCYFWPLLNGSGYLAALGLRSCMSTTWWSSVVAAAIRQGKPGT